jgi:CelD/BcsL family acetyltransferase involved in cellulose biosynthesis
MCSISSSAAMPSPFEAGSGPLAQESTPLTSHATAPQWWQALYEAAPDATVFVSPTWMQAWLQRYGKGFGGEWVRWHVNGKTVGGVLALWRTRWRKGVPLRCIYLNTSEDVADRSPQTEFNQILHLPGYAQQVSAALASYLQQRRWDCVKLAGFEQTPMFADLLGQLRSAWAEQDNKPAPFIDLLALPAGRFETTLMGRAGAQLRQSFKRYEEVFGPLTLEQAQDEATRQHYLDELARLHNALWRERGERGAFDCATFTTFHQTLVSQLGAHSRITLLRATAGTHVLGYLYAFNDHGCVYVYQSGFCYESDTKLRPGLVTHALAVTHCRDQGLREYNLMAGESQYKRALAKQRRDVSWVTLYRDTLASRLFIALRDAKRKFKPVQPPQASGAATGSA